MILIYSQSLLLYCIYGFVLYCFVIGRENSTCAFNQSDTRIEHPISEHTSSQSSVFFRTIIETKRIEDEHSGSNVCAEAEFSMSMQRALRLSEPSYLIRVTKNRTSQYAKVFVWSAPNRMVNKQDTVADTNALQNPCQISPISLQNSAPPFPWEKTYIELGEAGATYLSSHQILRSMIMKNWVYFLIH